MKIAMVASESNPLAKTGGLADVVFSLSKELVLHKNEVAIFIPYYQAIKRNNKYVTHFVTSFDVTMSWRHQKATICSVVIDNVTFYLIENYSYFDRNNYYGYDDDGERFAFFSLAVRDAFKALNFKADIVHIHDWQPGMLPAIIREQNVYDEFYRDMKFVLTIHNEAFQGFIDRSSLQDLYNLDDSIYSYGKVRFFDKVSTLKSAIIYSDRVTSVSPTHAKELLTPEGSKNLDSIINLRRFDFLGIVNGIDTKEFNPKTDKHIWKNYDEKTVLTNKAKNKEALLKMMNLEVNDKPLFGVVSRLTWQKGLGILLDMIEQVLNRGFSFICLGSGEWDLEQRLEILRARYPKQVGIYIGYNDDLAHKIYAGSDFFFMPSLFEPCGIGQLIAERYGTLPIVRLTG